MDQCQTRPKGRDIGRWAHANVKLHFSILSAKGFLGPYAPNYKDILRRLQAKDEREKQSSESDL